ncbi:delta-60 repeat domain-containing protein [Nocardioides coralli]|uniref:delta-60 repeat domain-containing protein n=1 Tax=Nocardioides coralli TaxID=2872154 RepID=UPI001CA41361|nr:delta-60 repeat domain-containing protein [Nocardioides coralli]QZY29809.1 delta-60 repeat domain-containing protein [Nocardioides coralli]
MNRRTCAVLVALTTAGAVALGTSTPAAGSDHAHGGVVSETAERWVPMIATTPGAAKPVAYGIGEAGDQMVVGGRFQTVENGTRTTQYNRRNVFAFDADTGAVSTGFRPDVNGPVWSIVSDGTWVWIGGGFTTVNGQPRAAVAKLDLATGTLDTTFNPSFRRGRVTDMEMHRGHLVIAGTIPRRLMSLNPDTGRATSYIGNAIEGRLPNSNSPQVFKFDISSDGQHLAAVGNFWTVDGAERPRMFLLDLSTTGSTVSAWNYEPNGIPCSSTRRVTQSYIQDVGFSPDSSWFAVAAFGFRYQPGQHGSQLCDSVARFETDELDPTVPTWINYTGGDSVKSVAATDAAIYTQGHSRWLDNNAPNIFNVEGPGAKSRPGGGAIDPVTGMAHDWNPVMPQQSGGFHILPTAEGVWFVTDGIRWGGRYHRGIRFAALP